MRNTVLWSCAAFALMALAPPMTARGDVDPPPVFTGGTGGISFGVTGYGLPQPGVPTYIPNNFTGFNDILASPGGTFLTANPVIANNIASTGVVGLAVGAFQVGGGNVNGLFGAGAGLITGPLAGFLITDSGPGGGSASYGIDSWKSTYVQGAGGYLGPYGTYLAIGGSVPFGSAIAVSLRTTISSVTAGSPFLGGVTLPQEVLAIAQQGAVPGIFSRVAVGGAGGANAAITAATNFQGIAIDNQGVVAIAAGDVITVTSTLTFYADPASFDSVFPSEIDPALIGLTGTTLPSFTFAGTQDAPTTIPEPASLVLLGTGLGMFTCRRYRRRIRVAA